MKASVYICVTLGIVAAILSVSSATLSSTDKDTLLKEQNKYRAKAQPKASNMRKLVSGFNLEGVHGGSGVCCMSVHTKQQCSEVEQFPCKPDPYLYLL